MRTVRFLYFLMRWSILFRPKDSFTFIYLTIIIRTYGCPIS